MKLVIGNKTYSSWSLRPWVLMRHFQIPFEEILIKLDLPTTTEEIKKYNKALKVPVLIDGDLTIWESLAIMEYLNEKFPDRKLYPADTKKRALARSVANEMHAGFSDLRHHLSFHIKKSVPEFDSSMAEKDIRRIKEIWTQCLEQSRGPFLFGDFSIADAMYAPVVGRFKTYHVATEGLVKQYCESILNLPAVKEWYQGAMAEDFIAPFHE